MLGLQDFDEERAPRLEPPNNIDENKGADHATLREERDQLRLALAAARLGVWEWELATDHVSWSPECFTVTGMATSQFGGTKDDFARILHRDDAPYVWARVEEALAGGRPYEADFRILRPDGTSRWLNNRGTVVRDASGSPRRLVGVVADITDQKQAEAALRASERKYHRLHESIRDASATVDMAGGIQECNVAFQEMLGYSQDELRQLTYVDLTPPRWHEMEARIVAEQILPKGSSDLYEKEYRRKDGCVFPVELRTFLIRDDDGCPYQMWAIVRDISERKRADAALRQSEARFRAFVTASSNVVYRLSPDWRTMVYLEGNAFGADADGPNSDWLDKYIHVDDQPRVLELVQKAIGTKSILELEHRTLRADGTLGWALSRAIPLLDGDGEIVEWFGATVDVTDRKAIEEQLREADRQKDQFVAILAHELRNPLAPIRTAVALLKTRQLSDSVLVRSRDVIDRQVAHMARLLDDLLDVSRLSRGTLTLQRSRVSLRDVLAAAVETAVPLIEQRAQALVQEGIDDSIALEGDPARLVQVFGNLLTNAAKYSLAHATIAIDVGIEGDMAVVNVRDTGVGIASENLESVFGLFSQFGSTDHAGAGGLGIGLALAKRLVELHGGTVTAASDGLERGSTFSVRLPFVRVAPVTEHVSASSSPPVHRRVLIADDNADAADMIALLLEALGCDVRTVYGGEAAVREAEVFHPEVAFLDLGMPDVDGWEVCRRIRSQPWGASIVLVALTGWGREDDRRRTHLAGFNEHLIKPADPEALVRLISGLSRVRIR